MATGNGCSVADVVCTSGPNDRPFEERHTNYSIAVVVAGSFEYRTANGSALMTPGSLMLGNAGQCFECGHEHGNGDRCVAFWYAPDYFERIAADAGRRHARIGFATPRLPALRLLAPLVALAGAGAAGSATVPWEELGVRLAACAAGGGAGSPLDAGRLPPNA